MRWNPFLRPARSLHAAPIQNLVLPFSFAFLAASNTGSMLTNFEALVAVEYRDDWEQYEPGSQSDICVVYSAE